MLRLFVCTADADPEAAARKLIEIANSIEPVQDGRIHVPGALTGTTDAEVPSR